ncbi:MAG: dUTP diphosphatase [Epsilonproteobacteria bacterium]|nr:dUTP diphosphatase [Campylobacterota bacterium]
MEIKVKKLSPLAQIPSYQSSQAAGFDLHAISDVVIKPSQRVLIGTGLALELPEGYELQIRPRSGLAYKHGITVLNSPGTVDSDYRGEIKVLLINHSDEDFCIKTGDRIAQAVIQEVIQATFTLTTQLSDTTRGSGGFGSTGK